LILSPSQFHPARFAFFFRLIYVQRALAILTAFFVLFVYYKDKTNSSMIAMSFCLAAVPCFWFLNFGIAGLLAKHLYEGKPFQILSLIDAVTAGRCAWRGLAEFRLLRTSRRWKLMVKLSTIKEQGNLRVQRQMIRTMENKGCWSCWTLTR